MKKAIVFLGYILIQNQNRLVELILNQLILLMIYLCVIPTKVLGWWMKMTKTNQNPKIGDIQTDVNGTEWIVVGNSHTGVSRVKRNSLAHVIHAQSSADIAKSLMIWENKP